MTEEIARLAADMRETMHDVTGFGLAGSVGGRYETVDRDGLHQERHAR